MLFGGGSKKTPGKEFVSVRLGVGADEKIKERVKIPLFLSLPWFVLSLFMLFSGIFLVVSWGGAFYVDHLGGTVANGFVSTVHMPHYTSDIMKIRWILYLPLRPLTVLVLPGIGFIISGISMLILRFVYLRWYVPTHASQKIA
jgi:hypothetical protein